MDHAELGGASRLQRGSRRALLKGKWATCSFLGVLGGLLPAFCSFVGFSEAFCTPHLKTPCRPPAPFLGPPAAFEPFGSHHGAQEPTFFVFAGGSWE